MLCKDYNAQVLNAGEESRLFDSNMAKMKRDADRIYADLKAMKPR
jgi:hypothetical protein